MRKKRSVDVVFYLGVVCLLVWIVDFINIVFIIQKSITLLWYSNTGLLATAIALLRRDSRLIFTLFCALFVIEGIWGVGFFSLLLFNKAIPGVADYAFAPSYSNKDFILSLYHLVTPISLLVALVKFRKVYKYGWVGAMIFASVLTFITYFLVDKSQNVNCVHTLDHCRSMLSFLYTFNNPLRLFLGIACITVVVYIPTNYILYQIGKRLRWKRS